MNNDSIGSGISGTVFAKKINKQNVAVKVFNQDRKEYKESFQKELEILKKFQDSNYVVKLIDFDETNYSIILERCTTNLFNMVNKSIDLKTQFSWVYQMTQGLEYIHSKGFVHCDFKLENVLLTDNNQIRICDFGFCTDVYEDIGQVTEEYTAPEILEGEEIGTAIDIWSLGVCIFIIGNGDIPFYGEEEIVNYEYYLTRECPEEFCDLIEKIFVYQDERPNADDLLEIMDNM